MFKYFKTGSLSLYDAKTILVEEQQLTYLTYILNDKGVHTFS